MRLRPLIGWAVFFLLASVIVQALPSAEGSYYFFKGKLLFAKGHYEAAADAYNQTTKSDPGFARAYIELGSSYVVLKEYSEAETAFKNARSINDDSCASCGLGLVYRVQGKTQEAESSLKRAIELNPRDTCGYHQLGELYYDIGDYSKSVDVFGRLIKLGADATTRHFLARALSESGKVEESIPHYREVIRLEPTNEVAYVDMATAYYRLGRYPEAIQAFQRALELKPNDIKARAFLAVTLFIQGDREAAQKQYRKVQELNPNIASELLKSLAELDQTINELQRQKSAKQKTTTTN